jgi:hypothetical protein
MAVFSDLKFSAASRITIYAIRQLSENPVPTKRIAIREALTEQLFEQDAWDGNRNHRVGLLMYPKDSFCVDDITAVSRLNEPTSPPQSIPQSLFST